MAQQHEHLRREHELHERAVVRGKAAHPGRPRRLRQPPEERRERRRLRLLPYRERHAVLLHRGHARQHEREGRRRPLAAQQRARAREHELREVLRRRARRLRLRAREAVEHARHEAHVLRARVGEGAAVRRQLLRADGHEGVDEADRQLERVRPPARPVGRVQRHVRQQEEAGYVLGRDPVLALVPLGAGHRLQVRPGARHAVLVDGVAEPVPPIDLRDVLRRPVVVHDALHARDVRAEGAVDGRALDAEEGPEAHRAEHGGQIRQRHGAVGALPVILPLDQGSQLAVDVHGRGRPLPSAERGSRGWPAREKQSLPPKRCPPCALVGPAAARRQRTGADTAKKKKGPAAGLGLLGAEGSENAPLPAPSYSGRRGGSVDLRIAIG